ncbi:MAG: type I-E CRISPR-associated protein Cas7/Cse4/CasC, partial [Pseudomonadota bacterium]
MTTARFLQIHTLHSYSAALLNRDDSGLAKRIKYGGAIRTRVSSQCLKRHWRLAEDPHALLNIAGAEDAFRSRELVTLKVIDPIKKSGRFSPATTAVINDVFQKYVYGDKGTEKKSRQTLLLGAPELNWLATEADKLAEQVEPVLAGGVYDLNDKKGIAQALKHAEEVTKPWATDNKSNLSALREQTALNAGLPAALFGRMVTSDPAANIDAPIHVAHAFTVHEEETESDYFTAVDDLKRDEDDSGADTIQETELTSGLFYGYVVVDVPGLVSNLTGCKRHEWTTPDR